MLYLISIVLLHYFKVSLWVESDWATLRHFNAFSNETTVGALPKYLAVFADYFVLLYVLFSSYTFSAMAILRYIVAIRGKLSAATVSARVG